MTNSPLLDAAAAFRPPFEAGDPYPLSPLQQGMFFGWLRDPHAGTDVEQIIADLHEKIDVARMERAWRHAIATFSTLRTAFVWKDLPSPMQRIERDADFRVHVEDLRALPSGAREARVDEFLRTDRREGFDLAHAPAMRLALFQLEDAQVRMVWSFHHILIDGRAFETILHEVFGHYDGAPEVAGADRPFRDYVEWVTRQDHSAAREFWRAHLRGFTAPTPIPTDRHPVEPQARFRHEDSALTPDVTARLHALAEREGLSLNTILLGAWSLLVSRYSSERDVVVGATKTVRRGSVEGAESIVGMLLATIPVRIRVDPEMSARDWLKDVRRTWTNLRGNEHVPLVDIRAVSEVPSSSPLFHSLVVFEGYRFGDRLHAQGGAWAARDFQILEQTGFPLTVLGYDGDSLALRIEYDAGLFDPGTIDRIFGHLTTVLEAWSVDVAQPVLRTPMLTNAERKRILEEWNDTASEYPHTISLAALVEEQVAKAPDAPAVTFGAETISYGELNARANRLARELQQHGAGPDVLVGLAVERSAGMMVALLAIIKSGAAYVPLDPMFPPDRIAHMILDSGLRILITRQSVKPSLPAFDGVVLELDAPTWDSRDTSNLGVAVGSESLAYVIYTSGSTGKPKGVQISRRALVNFLWSMREWLGLTAGDRLLAVTTISFDIAGLEIWLPWLVGAHTIVATREAAADGELLRDLITRHDITFLQATPITWRQLLEVGWTGKRDLQAICGGEAMPPEIAERVVPLVGKMWNMYGPTETTIWSTGVVVQPGAERISIGKPVANTQCHILDEIMQPVPAGVIGELYIAGDGLARGYLNRPDLNAEKFLADPFSTRAGARMYRTGDLARYLPDGTIECLGRTDHQVKIRGFRIELGEIESALRMHPGVRQAVVVARDDVPGKRLVGYVVPEGEPVDTATLRAHLKQSLPEYMVPAAMVSLDGIPLTANGKIDRRALPAPDQDARPAGEAVVEPTTHVEKQLSEIWEEIFGIAPISVSANFFDLGGHSILAVKMMSKVHRVFGKDLSLNALFESPTVSQLARHIEDASRTVGRHSLVSIQSAGSRPPIFWIPGGAALGLFRLANIVTSLGPDQPVYGLGSGHPESLADVETAEQRSAKYLELVRRVQPHGPYCLAGFCAGGRVAFEMAQQLTAAGEPVAFVGMINCSVPNYPAGRVKQLSLRAQRLINQLRQARASGTGLVQYVRNKLEARKVAQRNQAVLEEEARRVKQSGLQQGVSTHNELLLNATVEVLDRYQPRQYGGAITLFISNEEAYEGVSRRLDARVAWKSFAAKSEVVTFVGGHDTVFATADVGSFAAALKVTLEKALAVS